MQRSVLLTSLLTDVTKMSSASCMAECTVCLELRSTTAAQMMLHYCYVATSVQLSLHKWRRCMRVWPSFVWMAWPCVVYAMLSEVGYRFNVMLNLCSRDLLLHCAWLHAAKDSVLTSLVCMLYVKYCFQVDHAWKKAQAEYILGVCTTYLISTCALSISKLAFQMDFF